MTEKEKIVLSLASREALARMLLDLGLFSKSQMRMRIECPNWEEGYFYRKVRCKGKNESNAVCAFGWDEIGSNSNCPLDGELHVDFNDFRKTGLEEVLAKNLRFTLQALVKRGDYVAGTCDILIDAPERLRASRFFSWVDGLPIRFFVVVDPELKDTLRAIRYIRLLWDVLKDSHPILVTKARANKDVFESQGIRFYLYGEEQTAEKKTV